MFTPPRCHYCGEKIGSTLQLTQAWVYPGRWVKAHRLCAREAKRGTRLPQR